MDLADQEQQQKKGTAYSPSPDSYLGQLGFGLVQLVRVKQAITLHAGLNLAVKPGEPLSDQSGDMES